MPVIPERARLLGQRHLRQPLDESGVVEIAEINAVIGGLDQPFAVKAVGEAGGLQQQILDIDGPALRYQVEHRPARIILSLDAALHAGEGWYVFADGTVERDFALTDQHHCRAAWDGLVDR